MSKMLANSKSLSLFKERFYNWILVTSLYATFERAAFPDKNFCFTRIH